MSTYRVFMHAGASLSISVDIDDADMDEEEAREAAIEAAYEQAPGSICAQCAGWRQRWGVDIDDWELDDDQGDCKAVERQS